MSAALSLGTPTPSPRKAEGQDRIYVAEEKEFEEIHVMFSGVVNAE